MQKKKNLFLIIVDQLRYDYKEFLPLLSKLAPVSLTCEINSIPTSSETQHAVISTGKLPKEHGVFGKVNLEEFIMKMEAGEYTTIAKLGVSYGFETNVIIGKSHLARILGSPLECAIRVYLDTKFPRINGYDIKRSKNIRTSFEKIDANKITPDNVDSLLIPVLAYLSKQESAYKQFYIVSLPSLDYIGHHHGPKSVSVIQHLNYLDKSLSSLLLPKINNSTIVIVGDHGCRTISNYVIEFIENTNIGFSVYTRHRDQYDYGGKYRLKTEGILQVIYDGGLLRIFGPKRLSDEDITMLGQFGDIIENATEIGSNSLVREIYHNSQHANLGDCVVVAKDNTTFCKANWLDTNTRYLVEDCERLNLYDLPIGEHGTYHPDDRKILFMTNHTNNLNNLSNVDLRKVIEEIMGKL